MATPRRSAATTLIEALEQEPRGFAFFAAIELLEAARPDGARLGWCEAPADEPVRFVGNPSLGFPSAEIDALERYTDAAGRPCWRMTVNLLGIYGQGSPLPTWYTEELIHAELDEHGVKDFLDLFQHRLVSLLRRCGKKYRYYLDVRPDGSDPISQWLYALMGVLHPTLRDGTTLDWRSLLAYTGLISMRQHSAPMIGGLLSHYFGGLPVAVTQFVEELAMIPPEQWALLGVGNCRLGDDCTIGERVPDCGGRISVVVGPMDFRRFQRFLPDGPDRAATDDLLDLLLNDPLRCDLAVLLRVDEIPDLQLGANSPCRLGWSTWLGPEDADGRVVFPG